MKQKMSIISIALLCVVILVSCKKLDPVSEKIIADIEAIGEVELDDEEKIVKIEEIYNNMSDEQKDQVENYIDLLNAKDEIEKLKIEKIQAERKERESIANNEPYKTAIENIRNYKGKIDYLRNVYYNEKNNTWFIYCNVMHRNVNTPSVIVYYGNELDDCYDAIGGLPAGIAENCELLDLNIIKEFMGD